ncbi:MAG: type III-B CRISPR module RAMP protein Cmr1 [Chloroflexi bacterium]|nr:type III-B CRISPR module RAMP protein Cmr1 [Chloroflexota bacterium]
MNRNRKPKSPPPDVKPRDLDEESMVRQTRKYELITPLFGGGANPQEADPITVVRGPEVRGQLRFWWRATRGGLFDGDLEAMRRAEEAIWGSAAAKGKPGPSKVRIMISDVSSTSEFKRVQIRRRERWMEVDVGDPSSPYSYVAFPLRKMPDKPAAGLREEGIVFTLELMLTQKEVEVTLKGSRRIRLHLMDEIEAALWAWETFGGIGARTRRGFGALHLVAIDDQRQTPPSCDQVERWLQEGLKKYVTEGKWPKRVPHLLRDMRIVLTPAKGDGVEAWEHLFGRLRRFRQSRYPDSHGRPYGRSKWPEADTVRRVTDTYSPGHDPVHPVQGKAPRGRFGLPMIIQFRQDDVSCGDPQPATLQGAGHERYASRLILRPFLCSDGKAVGIACVLEGPADPPGGYVLKTVKGDFPVEAGLTQEEADEISPLKGKSDVLQAFLDYL